MNRGFSPNYWSAVENDRTVLPEDKLILLAKLLDFTPAETAGLLALREAARQPRWWTDFDVVLGARSPRCTALSAGRPTSGASRAS